MPRYLAIETSSPRLSLAAGDDRNILATYESALQWRHAETLFEGMQTVLKKALWRVQTLTGVAVCTGPGSFTGIRIGLAAARALGQTLKIPVVGISSLEVMAMKEQQTVQTCLPAGRAGQRAAWVNPSINALRGDVFTALFEMTKTGTLKRRAPEQRIEKGRWEKQLSRRVPRGANVKILSDEQGHYPEAGVLLALARPRLALAKADSYKAVLPFYLRDAAAVERKT